MAVVVVVVVPGPARGRSLVLFHGTRVTSGNAISPWWPYVALVIALIEEAQKKKHRRRRSRIGRRRTVGCTVVVQCVKMSVSTVEEVHFFSV